MLLHFKKSNEILETWSPQCENLDFGKITVWSLIYFLNYFAQPKIHSHSQIFWYGGSIFCLPHRPNFSGIYPMEGRSQLLSADLCCILRVFHQIFEFFIVKNSKSAAISPFMERIGRNSGVKLLSASPLKWRGVQQRNYFLILL